MLGHGMVHEGGAKLEMVLSDVRGRARHPQGAVLDLLAQVDEERLVVGKLEPAAGELADQRRRLETPLEVRPHHRELAQHVRDRQVLPLSCQ